MGTLKPVSSDDNNWEYYKQDIDMNAVSTPNNFTTRAPHVALL